MRQIYYVITEVVVDSDGLVSIRPIKVTNTMPEEDDDEDDTLFTDGHTRRPNN